MKTIELKASAKINLSIDVLSKRKDGYHEVAMVIQQIDLWDRVKISYYENLKEGKIIISSDDKRLPNNERNLAHKAARLMQERYPDHRGDIKIHIAKKIPVGGGLGGGSADAASVFHGLNILWQLGLSPSKLMEMGVKIGADIPFLIGSQAASNEGLNFGNEKVSTCALAEGIGEKLTPLPPLNAMVVLKNPGVFVSTKEIYGAIDLTKIKKRPDTQGLIEGLYRNDFNKVTSSMYNVLEDITKKKYPIVQKEIDTIKKLTGYKTVMMSGSGPTVFAMVNPLSLKEE